MIPLQNDTLKKFVDETFKGDHIHDPENIKQMFYLSFVWHFEVKRNWKQETIWFKALEKQLLTLDNLLSGKADQETCNYYFNQLGQYLKFQITKNPIIQRHILFMPINKSLIQPIFRILKSNSINEFQESLKEDFDVRNRKKINEPDLHERMNRILEGYQEKYDDRTEPFFLALLQFQEYLIKVYNGEQVSIDTRYKSNLDKHTINEYFEKLNTLNSVEKKYLGEEILSREDIDRFLGANFTCFPWREKKKVYAKCTQLSLNHLFYNFYSMDSKIDSVKAETFHEMLKNNFSNYDDSELSTIKKAFSRSRLDHYAFN